MKATGRPRESGGQSEIPSIPASPWQPPPPFLSPCGVHTGLIGGKAKNHRKPRLLPCVQLHSITSGYLHSNRAACTQHARQTLWKRMSGGSVYKEEKPALSLIGERLFSKFKIFLVNCKIQIKNFHFFLLPIWIPVSEQRQTVRLSAADEMLPGKNYLQSVFVLGLDTFQCLRICGYVMQIHKFLGCSASVFWLMFLVRERKQDPTWTQTHSQ